MKKVLVIGSVVLVAIVIFGAGFVFAQPYLARAAGLPAGNGFAGMMNGRGGMMGGGRGANGMGQIHDYVEQALADKLGMTEAQIETEQAKGKSLSQIAIDKGTVQADVAALLTEVHKTALAKAVTGGLLTQAQADAMLQMMTANGFNDGFGGMMSGGRGGYGQIHTYVEQALADKLGMSLADLDAAEAKGQSWSQIAISKGTAAADVNALLAEVHKTALAKAVTDGVLTQAQADAMLQNMTANGFNDGFGPGMMGGRGGYGQIRSYVEQALADKLGMSLTDFQAAEANGQSWSQIAISKGTAQADVTNVLSDAAKTGLAKAVTDKVLTQAQADTMLQNMTANGFDQGWGGGRGGMMDGRGGGGRGRGGMMGPWGQNQQAAPTPSISTQQ